MGNGLLLFRFNLNFLFFSTEVFTENKILQLDEKFDIPQIEIPDPDK